MRSLVQTVVRIQRLVPTDTAAEYDSAVLTEPAETRLHETVLELVDHSSADISSFVSDARGIVAPVSAFFDDVLIMADEERLREARLGLLATVRDRAPRGIDWRALDSVLN